MKVRVLPKQEQLVFSFAADETKGKQKAAVCCSYTLKEGDTTDELILNFEEGEKSEKWSFHRESAGEPKSSKDTKEGVQELKAEVKVLRQQLEQIEKRLSEIEKAKQQ